MARPTSWIIGIAVVGILIALYGLTLHYDADGGSICDLSETVNCDKVNKSQWSEFLGIPVALLGAIAYAAMALLVLYRKPIRAALAFTDRDYWNYLSLLAIVMCGFQIYLTYVEVFLIHAICIACVMSQICVITLAFFILREWSRA